MIKLEKLLVDKFTNLKSILDFLHKEHARGVTVTSIQINPENYFNISNEQGSNVWFYTNGDGDLIMQGPYGRVTITAYQP